MLSVYIQCDFARIRSDPMAGATAEGVETVIRFKNGVIINSSFYTTLFDRVLARYNHIAILIPRNQPPPHLHLSARWGGAHYQKLPKQGKIRPSLSLQCLQNIKHANIILIYPTRGCLTTFPFSSTIIRTRSSL
jgi:hypothetical protein